MEINVNLVLFEELQEKLDDRGMVARIVVIREGKDVDFALDEDAAGFDLLE